MTRLDHEKLKKKDSVRKPAPTTSVRAAGLGESWIKMTSKYPNTCKICPNSILIGQKIMWNKHTQETYHSVCLMNMINGKKNLPPEPPKAKPRKMKKGYQERIV